MKWPELVKPKDESAEEEDLLVEEIGQIQTLQKNKASGALAAMRILLTNALPAWLDGDRQKSIFFDMRHASEQLECPSSFKTIWPRAL